MLKYLWESKLWNILKIEDLNEVTDIIKQAEENVNGSIWVVNIQMFTVNFSSHVGNLHDKYHRQKFSATSLSKGDPSNKIGGMEIFLFFLP